MKIIIGGGGTAGHINPGIAIYQELRKRGYTVFYVLREDDLSYDVTECIQTEDRILVPLKRVQRSFSLRSFYHVYMILASFCRAFSSIKKTNPDLFIMTGGYVSNIVALAAFFLCKPLFIYENNSVAGITNAFWSIFSKNVFTMFPDVHKISKNKIICTGNPILYKTQIPRSDAKKYFSLDRKKTILGIMTGSQGSQIINDLIFSLLQNLLENGYQILWILGTREYDRLIQDSRFFDLSETKSFQENIRSYRFLKEMDMFWTAIDLIVARAGAGTIAEAMFFQKPAIFIPIKNSPDNHQFLNAIAMEKQGYASIIEELNLNSDLLMQTIKACSNKKMMYHVEIKPIEIPEEKIVNILEKYLLKH